MVFLGLQVLDLTIHDRYGALTAMDLVKHPGTVGVCSFEHHLPAMVQRELSTGDKVLQERCKDCVQIPPTLPVKKQQVRL